MKRVIELPIEEAKKVYARQTAGTMKTYFDDEQYQCFDETELANYKPRKSGRKSKKCGGNKNDK